MTVTTMIRLLRPRSVVAALALWPLATFGQAGSVNGTLPEDNLPGLKTILTDAINLSPRMLDGRIALAQGEAARIAAVAGLYPRLSGNSGYSTGAVRSAAGNSNSSSSSSGFNYGLGISQALFMEGDVKARADMGKLGEEIAKRNYAEAYRLLLGALRSQYLQLVVKKAAVAQARLQVAMQDKELAAKEDSIERGVSARDELAPARGVAETIRLAADRQAQDLENSKRVFARLAGLTLLDDSAIPEFVATPRFPEGTPTALLAAFLRKGVTETPQAQINALYLRQAELGVRTAKYVNYPKISLGAGYNTGANTSSDSLGHVSQSFVASRSASVSMTFTLLDAGAARAGKLAAASTKRSYERQLQTYIDTTRDEAERLEKQVSFEFRAMQLAELNLAIISGSLALDRQYLISGQRAQVDVERSEAAYKAAEIYAFSTRAGFLQMWSDFVSLVGADPMMNQLPASYLNHGK